MQGRLSNVYVILPGADILGIVFPADGGISADNSFAFILGCEETAFIKDDEADKIDYAHLPGNIFLK